MKRSRQIAVFFSVMMVMSLLCITANAAKVGDPVVHEKSTEYGLLKSEFWVYDDVTSTGRIGWEPTVRTSISSPYTMALTYVNVECQYADTGTYPASNWCDQKSEYNKNYAEVNMYFTAEQGRDIVVYSTHEVTYTRTYTLYAVNEIESHYI